MSGVAVGVAAAPSERQDVLALLAAALGHDELVAVRHTPGGRPLAVTNGTDLRISVAHTRTTTVVAWAVGVAVGVDVEALDRDVSGWALERHALTRAERARLPEQPGAARGEALLRAWVRKEAVLKAAGLGLGLEPGEVELAADGSVLAVPASIGPADRWCTRDLDLPGHAVSVAAAEPIATVTLTVHAAAG